MKLSLSSCHSLPNGVTREWESIVLSFFFGCDITRLFLGCLSDNFNTHHLIQESWFESKVYKGFSSDSNLALTKERKAGWHKFSLRNKLRHRRALHDFFPGTLGRRDWTPGDLIPPTPTWALQVFLFPVKWKYFSRMQLAGEKLWPWQSVKGASKKFLGCVWPDSCSVDFGSWKKSIHFSLLPALPHLIWTAFSLP